MKMLLSGILLLLSVFYTSSVEAQNWETPVIKGYGSIVDYPDAAITPDQNMDYKLLFHIRSDKEKEGVIAGLGKVARVINLMGKADVPARNVHIVVVISGPATPLVLSESAYKKRTNQSNPNLDLMKKLTQYGVEIHVCGQAVAERDINTRTDLSSYTKLTQSALIDRAYYQTQGFVLMPS